MTTATTTLRILYLEDDPVLRELLSGLLRDHPRVSEVLAYGDPRDVLDAASTLDVDVALLDLALGETKASGVEVGIALRGPHPELPIVVFSQHAIASVEDILPPRHRGAWSFLQKTGRFDVDELIRAIDATVDGASRVEIAQVDGVSASALQQLTPRQREIMALASTGLDARAIADRLFLAHVTVRSELSRTYRVLVPNAPPGTDLRTAAVLEYLRLASPAER